MAHKGYEPKRTFSFLSRILFDDHLDAFVGMCCRIGHVDDPNVPRVRRRDDRAHCHVLGVPRARAQPLRGEAHELHGVHELRQRDGLRLREPSGAAEDGDELRGLRAFHERRRPVRGAGHRRGGHRGRGRSGQAGDRLRLGCRLGDPRHARGGAAERACAAAPARPRAVRYLGRGLGQRRADRDGGRDGRV